MPPSISKSRSRGRSRSGKKSKSKKSIRLKKMSLSPRGNLPGKIPLKLYKSSNPSKKFDIWVPVGDRFRRVSFGGAGYEDYTTHKDKERRERYRNRHRKDHIKDPLKPGFWAYWILWGDSTDKDKNLKEVISRLRKG